LFKNSINCPRFWANFSTEISTLHIRFDKTLVGQHFGRIFSQTHLVTLLTSCTWRGDLKLVFYTSKFKVKGVTTIPRIQGDQIGRIFKYGTTIHFEQFIVNYRSSPNFGTTFYTNGKRYALISTKNWSVYILDNFLKKTHLVILQGSVLSSSRTTFC
jgi:hypothetical protein